MVFSIKRTYGAKNEAIFRLSKKPHLCRLIHTDTQSIFAQWVNRFKICVIDLCSISCYNKNEQDTDSFKSKTQKATTVDSGSTHGETVQKTETTESTEIKESMGTSDSNDSEETPDNAGGSWTKQYYICNTHQAIVERELYDSVQKILNDRRNNHSHIISTISIWSTHAK